MERGWKRRIYLEEAGRVTVIAKCVSGKWKDLSIGSRCVQYEVDISGKIWLRTIRKI